MTVKPITPKEAKDLQADMVPEFVVLAVNELVAKNYAGGYARFTQQELVDKLVNDHKCDRNKIYECGWLNFEHLYERNGWKVEYDKPAYNESYDAFFLFEAKGVDER